MEIASRCFVTASGTFFASILLIASKRIPPRRARRAEQARYFGLNEPSESAGLRAAYLASGVTRRALSQPFTVYTRWQRVDPDNE